jgi:dTDP-4-amino-4,6-dideoxygalactose transaminase
MQQASLAERRVAQTSGVEEKIQLFVPKFRTRETLAAIEECLERGWTGMGFKTVEFEKQWQAYCGVPHAHFLNSATAALHMAVVLPKEKFGWNDGDEIITTPMTFVSTNHAILYAGLKPVFADIDQYGCLDPASVRSRITPRTRGVMFVGLGGSTGQLSEIRAICDEHKLMLMLDASHMAGTRLNGRDATQIADVTCHSFQAVKNLPTADSGSISFADGELDREARKFSWLGINKDTYARSSEGTYSWQYDVEHVGFKYNGNAVMAAMALVALKYVDEDNAHRRHLASLYDDCLRSLADVERIGVPDGCVSSRHLYQVKTSRRNELLSHLNRNGIYPGVHYNDNILYRMYSYAEGTCPKARAYSDEILSLPMHLNMTDRHVNRISDTIASFFRS